MDLDEYGKVHAFKGIVAAENCHARIHLCQFHELFSVVGHTVAGCP